MYTDSSGMAPETWQWIVSGLAFTAGVVLVATGAGGALGGILICAGVNSIIGSYTSEAAGGSSTAGWIGGAISGALCGAGASIAGTLIYKATETVGFFCLGNLVAGYGTAFGLGFVGSYVGQHTSAALDGKALDTNEVLCSAFATGAINLLAGMGSGMGEAIKSMPAISTTCTTLANSLNAAWSVTAEAICDALSVVIGLFG